MRIQQQAGGGGQKCYVSGVDLVRVVATCCAEAGLELWPFRAHCTRLPWQWCFGGSCLCIPPSPSWSRSQHVYVAPRQVLSVRRTKPHGQVGCFDCSVAAFAHFLFRDCLAAESSLPTGPASMKSKTCYKCQQEGHVRFSATCATHINSAFCRSPENAQRMPILWDKFLY